MPGPVVDIALTLAALALLIVPAIAVVVTINRRFGGPVGALHGAASALTGDEDDDGGLYE